MKVKPKQSGFILIVFIVLLLLISSFKLMSSSRLSAEGYQYLQTQKHQHLLNQAKQNLLLFAQLTPELYATNSNGNFLPGQTVPSPGYLPCPDTDFNGQSNTPCGQNADYVFGQLPHRIATRHFNLNHPHRFTIWYAVDSRYVIQNADYHNPPTKRFAPLNPLHPGNGRLSLNQQTNLVAFLILEPHPDTPAQPQDFQPTPHQFTHLNKPSLTLSHAEWQQALRNRLQSQRQTLCNLDPTIAHWFNACNNRQSLHLPACANRLDQTDNPVGSNWRVLLC